MWSENHNYFLLLGDKQSYLSLPRPGVSITISILMNIPLIHYFVILIIIPLSLPTETLSELEDCQGRQVGPRGSVHHTPLAFTTRVTVFIAGETLCHSFEELTVLICSEAAIILLSRQFYYKPPQEVGLC